MWLKHNLAIFSILYYRAVELIEEAGFKVGKSDGGLVTEAKPPVKWDKGNAAIYILKTAYGVHWADNIRVIFAGDDLTDEDAMKALKVAFTTYLRLYQNNCDFKRCMFLKGFRSGARVVPLHSNFQSYLRDLWPL